MIDETDAELVARAERITELEGQLNERLKVVEKLNRTLDDQDSELDELHERIVELQNEQAGELPDLKAALHMFHDQYHQSSAWRLCTEEPCRDITARLSSIGPAPLTLVGAA